MPQSFVEINNKMLPVIDRDGINYYPINFINEKVLMKSSTPSKHLAKQYNLVKLPVEFWESNIQESNCVDGDTLIQILKNCNTGCMSENQLKIHNELRSLLEIELLQSKFSIKPSDDELSKYSLWEQECISIDELDNPDAKWKNCSVCHKYYPMTDMFFAKDPKSKINQRTECRCCMSMNSHFSHPDDKLDNINSEFGFDIYIAYRDHDVIKIYEHWIETKYCVRTPKIIHNEADYLTISKHIYHKNKYTNETISLSLIEDMSQLTSYNHSITNNMLYYYLFDEEPYHKPWKYNNYKCTDKSIEHAVNLFNTYLNEYNIIIDNVYNFDYRDIIKKARIHTAFDSDLLSFVMYYHQDKYPAYQFNIPSIKYWKPIENRIQALKYFIEEDMKLQLEKVPLYLTLTSLRNFAGTTTMYGICKKYYKSLFEWVNELYPDGFDPKDFDINYFRNDFDSVEESQVHDILTNNLKNVLYNPRNTDRTIELGGKVPDWIIITDKNMYVIEYFGITNDREAYNSRTEMYKKKMTSKLEVYETITYCKYIFLYPHDMVDNFKGILEKINCIIVEQS